ncbi:hypothetical protein CEP54_015570 [Fusarium duplospermum]|uniref:Uncharacterized protein n=1 Tax=Fusarium duplospermum TaxID=1325734 RepID=A0A428NN37_9HYPO|nr:hypothetical protein CEP54_015570 [Fusarium duplospermum]
MSRLERSTSTIWNGCSNCTSSSSPKLASVETTSNSADAIISEARESLKSKLTGTNVVSTIGSGLSAIGGFVIFSPFGLVGVGLVALGTLTSAASSLVKKLIFEKGAATSFVEAIHKYSTSSDELQTLNEDIEKAKQQLLTSLALFLRALQIEAPPIPPGPGGPPTKPGSPKPGGGSPFSSNILKGIEGAIKGGSATKPWIGGGAKFATEFSNWLARGGAVDQAFGKAFPTVIKRLPLASIAIDVYSIINTWTGTNETLEKAEKLRKDIQNSKDEFRKRVQQYLSALEELVGNPALQLTLHKLMRLYNAISGRPGGSPGQHQERLCYRLCVRSGRGAT